MKILIKPFKLLKKYLHHLRNKSFYYFKVFGFLCENLRGKPILANGICETPKRGKGAIEKVLQRYGIISNRFLDFKNTLPGIWISSQSREAKASTLPGIRFRSKSREAKSSTLPGIRFRSKSREAKASTLPGIRFRIQSRRAKGDVLAEM